MRDVDPGEIPPNGERQDMTLDGIGFDSNDGDTFVIKAVIDTGEYAGKRVSSAWPVKHVREHSMVVQALVGVVDVPNISATALSREQLNQFAHFLHNQYRRDLRFSARVCHEVRETRDQRLVRYELRDISEPERSDPDLYLRKNPTQFNRDLS